jgi:hypothetical protein
MQTEADFTFLQGKLRSLVEWDVLQFFHHNPHAVEGAVQIVTALGREPGSVHIALDALHSVGLLERIETQTHPIYRLTQDARLRDEIEQFMHACDNAAFRRRVIEQILAYSAKR